MIFDHPFLALLAPLVGLALALLALLARRRRVALAGAWSATLGARAAARGRGWPWAFGACGCAAALALAGPRGGPRSVTTQAVALDLMLAVDVSRSMLAEDVAPSRLKRAVREARRLVDDLPGDRVGLVAFAGRSYILAPLTVDGGAVRMFLDALDPDLASEGGTSLGAVLRQGAELLATAKEGSDRVLVVFTDGEAHDSLPDVRAAATALRRAGIRLILVAEGGPAPVKIPIRDQNGALVEYKLDDDRQPVLTARSDSTLRAIAEAGDGALVASELPDQAGAVRAVVSTLRRSAAAERQTADREPLAWVPALVAALVLGVLSLRQRNGALAVLALMLAAGSAEAQRPAAGERAWATGDAAAARAAWLAAAKGEARDTALFNAGTAALSAKDYEQARAALGEAAKSVDPGVRYRALYNLGVAALQQARADTAGRQARLEEAVGRLKEALLLEPGSRRAKWNLELAERLTPPPSGGGGGAGPTPPRPQPAKPEPRSGGLSRSQAEQILSSMEREELATQQERQRRAGGPRRGKDW